MSSKYVVGSLALLGTAAACATCTYYLYWRKNEGDEQKKRIDELVRDVFIIMSKDTFNLFLTPSLSEVSETVH